MNNLDNWDDFRVVMAIALGGGLSGAARILGRSHATIYRRIGEIERSLGVRLFERNRTGYVPTAAGEEVVAAAKRIENEVHDTERLIAGQDTELRGLVRVTTTDSLMAGLLSGVLAQFRTANPSILLNISVSNEVHDLSRRDADVAVRPAASPPEMLVGRKIGLLEQAVYAKAGSVDPPVTEEALKNMTWVGPDERMVYRPLEAWMTSKSVATSCAFRIDSVLGMCEAIAQGIGIGVLPLYLAEKDERLVRVTPPIDTLATDLWLLTHPDLKTTARVRAFTQFAATEISRTLKSLTWC